MTTFREDAAAFGIALDNGMLAQFARYRELLLEWNERLNLTAITQPREIEVKHFLDSLCLLRAAQPAPGASLLDVGTGAGFPGVPAKIARPDLHVTLLDSLQKRVRFLEELSAALGQDNEVLHGRAEDRGREPSLRGRFDLVTARAVARLGALCEYCMPFVRVGGVFAALKGPDCGEELDEAEQAIRLLGGRVLRRDEFILPMDNRRSIILIEKIERTPSKYPRRPAQISKAPLGL